MQEMIHAPYKTNYRWVIAMLLFFATTINYMDRQVIGLLKDWISKDLHWSEQDYSHIVMAFTFAYAAGLLIFGRIIDQIGTRLGYAISIIIWSLAAIGHALARSTLGFGIARTTLGLGESGNFPSAIKAVAEWFPKKERAFATGIFNSGTNIAAIICPFLVMWIFRHYGWKQAFVWTGTLGFVWLIFWWIYYEIPIRQKRVGQIELAHIESDHEDHGEEKSVRMSWAVLFRMRKTWSFFLGKFLTDPIWWFYLFWIPSYFNSVYHLDLSGSWMYVSAVYTVASLGSIFGGWLPGRLIHKGWPVLKARKTVMFIYALCVTPVICIRFTSQIGVAVALISLAAAAHQAWSANIFTTVSDSFPKKAVSSVVGIGGMAGSIGGTIFPLFIGLILDHFKLAGNISAGYNILFIICSANYLIAWLGMHFLNSSIKPVST
jgi:MFS transporter, ACS family, hexuronate transporter